MGQKYLFQILFNITTSLRSS